MIEPETAVRRFYESLSTGNATLADEVPTPDPKTSRCPRPARTRIIERSVFAAKQRQRSSIQQISGVPRELGARRVDRVNDALWQPPRKRCLAADG